MENKKNITQTRKHNILLTAGYLGGATAIAFFFFHFVHMDSANIALIYILALILIARNTSGYSYGIFSSLFCVICINYCFTYPYFKLNFTLSGYPVTFLGMLAITTITSAMTTRLKKQEVIIAEREKAVNDSEKERIRANLLRAVSHDLRTPLTSIIGTTASYIEDNESLTSAEKLELISAINDDAHWLLNMVENLLSVTRIQDSGSKVNKNMEMVEEVVSEAIIRLEKRIPGVSINVSAPADVLIIPMDPILIEQVLINLLENAIVHSQSSRPVELNVTEEADTVTFHIIDYGTGIDEASLPEILNGQYTHTNTSDKYKGMGIGLSICNSIVKAHGGIIKAHNHAEGAEISFTLPKEEN